MKAEALRQVDGDYDVFYAHAARHRFSDGQTLEEKLAGQGIDISAIAASIPKLQLSVPVNCEEWNTEKYVPLVAVSPEGIDEKDMTTVKAFDFETNVHWLDSRVDPDVPVLVVGVSERMDEQGNLKYPAPPMPPDVAEQKGARMESGRQPFSMEYLQSIRIEDMGAIEAWVRGKPDLRLHVVAAESATKALPVTGEALWHPKRKDIHKRDWTPYSNFLFTWLDRYGEYVSYKWMEEDGGIPIQLTVDVTYKPKNSPWSASAKVVYDGTKHSLDDDCGTYPVHISERRGQRYGSNLNFVITY